MATETESKRSAVIPLGDINADLIAFLYDKKYENLDKLMTKIEHSTPLKREQVMYIAGGLVILYLIIGSAAQLLCNFIGFAYPAYTSVKAVKTKEKDDDTQWLIYWTVFACFSLMDFFAKEIMDIVPLYWLAKLVFLLYLALPYTRGALKMYEKVVEPLFLKIQPLVESKFR